MASPPDTSKATSAGALRFDKCNSYLRRVNTTTRILSISSKLLFRTTFLIALILILYFTINYPPSLSTSPPTIHSVLHYGSSSSSSWEKQVRRSATPTSPTGLTVLVTGAAGFVGSHCSIALRHRGDGVVGLDNFNSYYTQSLKRDRQFHLLHTHNIFIVESDLNDTPLLTKLFNTITFTHVLHLAAQAGVRYAMKNPQSYISSNIAGFISLLEVTKSSNPQPAIIWASSSSVYGLNTKVPFSEHDRTDRPASLYAATKKAGEEIAHTYNHIYGLSLTGLRFFTVYGPWGRPDMAYFFFTDKILSGKPIEVYETVDGKEVARDFTYIDDVVKGCLGAIDTAEKSTGSGGKKKRNAQLRVYNLGNTAPVGVGKLVRILEKLLGVEAKKKVMTMPSNGDVPFTHANVSAARRDFGYEPSTDLETGLKKFVDWYVEYYGVKKTTAGKSRGQKR